MSTDTAFELQLQNITKVYPGVVALDDVSLRISAGEVVGLIGENGAGKSTLMKVLGGVIAPSSGSITISGETYEALSVQQSFDHGIAFVHQELNLFDNLSVAANMLLGREIRSGFLGLVDEAAMARAAQPILDRIGARFSPSAQVSELSIAEQQMLEIAKALSMDSRLVILDEPTSSLTLSETNRLLKIIADLKAHGVAVLFISHRLSEVEQCADRVVVLRDGRDVGHLSRDEINYDAMIRLMIGRTLASRPPEEKRAAEPVVALQVEDLRTHAYPAGSASLAVRSGEIMGLAGLVGAGRTELARAIFGIDGVHGGTIRIAGRTLSGHNPQEAIAAGLCLVPEDRKGQGLILDFSVGSNICLADLQAVSRNGFVDRRREAARAAEQRDRLKIKVESLDRAAAELSGGNQQKVALGKWLALDPRVIIFDEPTRGIDVGSKAEIYGLMRVLTNRGCAILMISSDMEEVISVSDRIAVMCRGRVAGVLEPPDFSEENVLTLAIG
ncbi:sugar ABC transporter ATP-binding protein [Pelagibius marinus]|uniref:sugar ABC transporter ATP-binding protein n=1 Tax=Pelagibius marinus TaxID=2762760 RepID=UPI00187249A2|nr:sugar ABC transporter ATP-binding protein [Pelagibius marinus]